ncbi:MAG: hypothetical protein QM539_10865 [Alphaproteobacteria bacterium]|nr:hypothetical protein [Alphaproteobacteria bacterium]
MKNIILIFILIYLSCHHDKRLEFEVDFAIVIRKSTINKSYKFNINSNNDVFELIRDNDYFDKNIDDDKIYKYKLVDSQKYYY